MILEKGRSYQEIGINFLSGTFFLFSCEYGSHKNHQGYSNIVSTIYMITVKST